LPEQVVMLLYMDTRYEKAGMQVVRFWSSCMAD